MKTIVLEIADVSTRDALVLALANAGIKTWITKGQAVLANANRHGIPSKTYLNFEVEDEN